MDCQCPGMVIDGASVLDLTNAPSTIEKVRVKTSEGEPVILWNSAGAVSSSKSTCALASSPTTALPYSEAFDFLLALLHSFSSTTVARVGDQRCRVYNSPK